VTEYWLADSEARVLGPVGLSVVRDLAVRGKLTDVRAVSRDGRNFVPLREMPELHAELTRIPQGDDSVRAQAHAAQEIRNWLASVRDRPTHEVFRVHPQASRDAWRAAFFPLVQRYVPGRLPPDATAELRLACEDAFLHLAERMVEIERRYQTSIPTPPPVAGTLRQARVSWSGGMLHVRMSLRRGESFPFTIYPEATWKTDSLFVHSTERVLVGTPSEIQIGFEGYVHPIQAMGRVVGVKTSAPEGFALKMLDLNEDQRAMIRTWVAKATP
jgi:hypothetical protein